MVNKIVKDFVQARVKLILNEIAHGDFWLSDTQYSKCLDTLLDSGAYVADEFYPEKLPDYDAKDWIPTHGNPNMAIPTFAMMQKCKVPENEANALKEKMKEMGVPL